MDIIVCVRTEDLGHPVPGALPAPCHGCGKQVWRSPATLQMTGRVEYHCVPCVAARQDFDPTKVVLTDASYAEAVRHVGLRSRKELILVMVDEILKQRRGA